MIESQARNSVVEGLFCNPRTGEYSDPTHILIPRRVKVTDWLMTFHKGTELLAKDKEIGAEGLRVFLYVTSHVDYENKLLVTQADVKEALEMKQSAVSRAFKLLVNKGILVEANKVGTSKTYYLSTDYGWKGSARRLKERLRDDLDNQNDESPSKKGKTPSSSNLGEQVA